MKDFVRHIVNAVLAEEGNNLSPRIIQEISGLFAHYEEKYRFSIYGGDIVNLAKFFSSSDFKEVVSIFRSNNVIHLLEKILAKSLEEYGDLSIVKNSILEACERFELSCGEGVAVDSHTVIEEYIKRKIPDSAVALKKNRAFTTILVESPTIRLDIKLYKSSSRIRLVIDRKLEKGTPEIYEVIDRVAEAVRCLRL